MPSLTQERQLELLADYEKLKPHILDIEHKYSLNYEPVVMNMPESLGLVKMQFVAPTEGQLRERAETKVAPKYTEKLSWLARSYENALANLQFGKQRANITHNEKSSNLTMQFDKKYDAVQNKLIDDGLYYSSIFPETMEDVGRLFNRKQNVLNQKLTATSENYDQKIAALTANYQQNIANVNSQREEAVAAEMNVLRDKYEKERISIEKYNAMVDEKEAKYRQSCERALQYARQAEYTRAYQAAKIYAQLGEVGYNRQKHEEMYGFCQYWFREKYTLAEAQFVLSVDSFLRVHLDSYYSTFVTWVENSLN